MDEEASIILGDAIAFCQRDGQDARLINMLGQSRAVSLTEDTLTIEAPSRFATSGSLDRLRGVDCNPRPLGRHNME